MLNRLPQDVTAAMIRRLADDEATDADRAILARVEAEAAPAAIEAIRDAVAFERSLRAAVAEAIVESAGPTPVALTDRVRDASSEVSDEESSFRRAVATAMSDVAAPAGLEAQLRAAMQAEPLDTDVHDVVGSIGPHGAATTASNGAADRVAGAATIETRPVAPSRVRRWAGWFDGPRRANAFAVAAVLGLVAGAIVFGIIGPNIDDLATPTQQGITNVQDASSFVASEHGRCTCPDRRQLKMDPDWSLASRVGLAMARHIGVEQIGLPSLESFGYDFESAGPCGVPGAYRSAHCVWRATGAEGTARPLISVFVVEDHGQFGTSGEYRIRVPLNDDFQLGQCSREVACIRIDGYAFFVCCCDPELYEAVVAALRAVNG